MKVNHLHLAALAGLVLSASSLAAEMDKAGVSAACKDQGGMGMMNMPMMKDHMAQMQDQMKRMKAAKSDKERMKLMQEHMEMMDAHMSMMIDMMDGGMGNTLAPAEAPPAKPSDTDHKAHHPG